MRVFLLCAVVAGCGVLQSAPAQQPAGATAPPLDVGVVAPNFTLPGTTRYGPLKEPVRLSDFRGKAVVLAFFYRARTRG